MTEQLSILPAWDPDALIEEAHRRYEPVRVACLFSGGNDSTVLAHCCRERYDELVHIDTGTAVPGVLGFVEEFAAKIGKPLVVYKAGDAYRTLVLGSDLWWERFHAARDAGHVATFADMEKRDKQQFGQAAGVVRRGEHKGRDLGQFPHGFPAPGAHGRAYSRLKERQIEAYVKRAKTGHSRHSKVMLLSGKRRAESKRRGQTTKGIEAKGGQLYANPLIDWTNPDMLSYRRTHGLKQSDVAALMHRSGECNCGAFASAAEERAMLKSLWPSWWASMETLETEAERRGVRWCRWGGYDLNGIRASDAATEPAGPLCSSCELRQFSFETS